MTRPAWSRPARLTPLALLPLLALGCASTEPLFDPGQTRARQDELERRLLELEKESVRSRLELERLRRRLAEVEATGAAPAAATPSAVPEVAGTAQPSPAPAAAQLAAAPEPSPDPGIEESELEEETPSAPPATQPATQPAAASDEDYERALRLLRDGHPAEAETALTAFATARPTSELADNAWFWIGESRLVRDDVAGALTAYRTAVETYPEGNKSPDALFKIGHCLARQGDSARAEEVWRELLRRFPDTAAGERARAALGPGS
jgi:tol-pal system protein YbgF